MAAWPVRTLRPLRGGQRTDELGTEWSKGLFFQQRAPRTAEADPVAAADSGEVLFFALPRPAHAPAHPPDAFPGHSEAVRARQARFGLSARTFPSLDAVEDRRAVRRPRRERKPPARRLRGPPPRPNRAFRAENPLKSSFSPARACALSDPAPTEPSGGALEYRTSFTNTQPPRGRPPRSRPGGSKVHPLL